MISYAIEIYGFISYIVPFLAQAGTENIKKKFFWVPPPQPAIYPEYPRTPLTINLLRSKDDEMNLVTT